MTRETKNKLQGYGATLLWVLGAVIFVAQAYRAVAYYLFDKPIEWNVKDIYVGVIAFAFMFIKADLKRIIINLLKSLSNKVGGK